MVYSSTAILALLVHIIINFEVLFMSGAKDSVKSHKAYRRFLFGAMAFYIADSLWGIIYDAKNLYAIYTDTFIYFMIMAVTVFLWTRYVNYYLNEKNVFIKAFTVFGWLYLLFDATTLIINFFIPVRFYFDSEVNYHACITRHISLAIQVTMFFITALYVFIYAAKTQGKERRRHKAVGFFGITMALFVIGQTQYPLLPLYAIGYLLGTCLFHTFVLEDEKDDYRRELEAHISLEELQKIELGTTRKLAYTDALTGVKNKRAYTEDEQLIELSLSSRQKTDFGIAIFDLNGLKIINDTKGHDAGDTYIKKSCHLICEFFRHSPIYRIGGDEFVAFLEGEDYSNRETLLADFNQLMEENLLKNDVVISCGLDIFKTSEEDSFSQLFERADKKMYERKRQLKASRL